MKFSQERREFLITAGVFTVGAAFMGAAILMPDEDQPQEQLTSGAIKTNSAPFDATTPKNIQSELNRLETRLRQQGRSALLTSISSVSELAAGYFCDVFQRDHYPYPLSPTKLASQIFFETASEYQKHQKELLELIDSKIITDPILYTEPNPFGSTIHYNLDSFSIKERNPLAHAFGDFLMEYHRLAAPERVSGPLFAFALRRFREISPSFDKGLTSFIFDETNNRYLAVHEDLDDIAAVVSTQSLLEKLKLSLRLRHDVDFPHFWKFLDESFDNDFGKVLSSQQSSRFNPAFEDFYN